MVWNIMANVSNWTAVFVKKGDPGLSTGKSNNKIYNRTATMNKYKHVYKFGKWSSLTLEKVQKYGITATIFYETITVFFSHPVFFASRCLLHLFLFSISIKEQRKGALVVSVVVFTFVWYFSFFHVIYLFFRLFNVIKIPLVKNFSVTSHFCLCCCFAANCTSRTFLFFFFSFQMIQRMWVTEKKNDEDNKMEFEFLVLTFQKFFCL